MLRRFSRVIALAAMLLGLTTAQAADTILTLACQGRVTDGMKDAAPEKPVSLGIIVNFTTRTVQAPGLADFPVEIIRMNEVTVDFGGSNYFGSATISGSIDRVTGDVGATTTFKIMKTGKIINTVYTLKCNPAQRMF